MTDSRNRQAKRQAGILPGLLTQVEEARETRKKLEARNAQLLRQNKTLTGDIGKKEEKLRILELAEAKLNNSIADLTVLQRKIAAEIDRPVEVAAQPATEKETQDPFRVAWDNAAIIFLGEGDAPAYDEEMTPADRSLQQVITRRNSIQRQRNGLFVLLKSVTENFPFIVEDRWRKGPHGIEIIYTMNAENKGVQELYAETPKILFSFEVREDDLGQHEVSCIASVWPKQAGHEPISLMPRARAGVKRTGWDLEIQTQRNPEASPSFERVRPELVALAKQIEAAFYQLAEPLLAFDKPRKPQALDLDVP